ncbi:MAG TPA: septum formation initiator family protein [Streptosporangiaceae bacterium]|nr:septum formation initiator family protein [Streptosporangiaceae bacterium]
MSPGGAAGRAGARATTRPKLTGRAALLAIVLCAITLTLAYPVREYIADRHQLDQLAASNTRLAQQVKHLQAEARSLDSPTVIEQEARDDLHMCFPEQTCYEVIPVTPSDAKAGATGATPGAKPAGSPWYGRLWASVQKADRSAAR